MGLFSTCSLCGKKKLALTLDGDGICPSCQTIINQERIQQKQAEQEQTASQRQVNSEGKFNVSSFVRQQDSDYAPPTAPTDEPVYLFIDVETTGLSPTKDAIVQVSALRFFGQRAVDGLNSYVNPQRPIPWETTKIHGITDKAVQDAPTIDKIKEPFINLAKGAILVGHNVTFDLNFLDHAFHGVLDGIEYIDTLWVAKKVLSLPNYRLETLADYAEFYPEGGFHDSLSDCTATAAIFFRLAFDKPGLAQIYHSKASTKVDYSSTPKKVTPVSTPENRNHPLYGKKIVFSGKLSILHKEAAQMATEVGAIVRGAVSGKTDYLVVGDGDTNGQEDKAYDLLAEGNTTLKIICEREFMLLIQGTTAETT